MRRKTFMKQANTSSKKKTTLIAISVGLGIIALSVASFFITKAVTTPTPVIPDVPDRILEDDFEEAFDKMLSSLTQPGDKIGKGESGKATISRDSDTREPLTGEVKVDKVKEVDPKNIGPLKMEKPLMEEFGARFWYLHASITVDKKPSDGTAIYFPLGVTNDSTPADGKIGQVFPVDNPDCLYGPTTWGEVKGNTAKMCRVIITFDQEDLADIVLIFNSMNYGDYQEYGTNPPTYDFTAEPIS